MAGMFDDFRDDQVEFLIRDTDKSVLEMLNQVQQFVLGRPFASIEVLDFKTVGYDERRRYPRSSKCSTQS